MSAGAAIVLGVGFAGLALAVNQMHARIALVEVTLNEGLPPGHDVDHGVRGPVSDPAERRELLGPGLHIFLSRNCVACQRLLDQLADRPLRSPDAIAMRYVDRPRTAATDVAATMYADLFAGQQELAFACGADPLPYAIAIGPAGLVTGSVVPTRSEIAAAARHAGIEVA